MHKVEMPYIGGVISKNSYRFKNGGVKPEAKIWMRLLSKRVARLEVPPAPKYRVGVQAFFADERRPDIQNLFEIVSDAVQLGLQVNDKHFILVDKGYSTGFLSPYLVISIEGVNDGQ